MPHVCGHDPVELSFAEKIVPEVLTSSVAPARRKIALWHAGRNPNDGCTAFFAPFRDATLAQPEIVAKPDNPH